MVLLDNSWTQQTIMGLMTYTQILQVILSNSRSSKWRQLGNRFVGSLAVKFNEPTRISSRLLIVQKGNILVGSLAVKVHKPERISISQPIRKLKISDFSRHFQGQSQKSVGIRIETKMTLHTPPPHHLTTWTGSSDKTSRWQTQFEQNSYNNKKHNKNVATTATSSEWFVMRLVNKNSDNGVNYLVINLQYLVVQGIYYRGCSVQLTRPSSSSGQQHRVLTIPDQF